MWIPFVEWNEMQLRLIKAKEAAAYAEARLDGSEELVGKLEERVKILTSEKKELLDELLIVSGVKMSKYQEALAQKELERTDEMPSFTGQTRQWAHQKEQESFMTPEEKNRRAIEIVRELEEEALIKTGGLGNV